MLFWLMVGHAVADYPLQGDFLARMKNRHLNQDTWVMIMSMHCLIHAGSVAWITQSPVLTAVEFFSHFVIDVLKCEGKTSFQVDQVLHILCKIAYVLLLQR